MTKQDFLNVLNARLSAVPETDRAGTLEFYGELIEDRIEEGMTEEAAVESVGTVDEIAAKIIEETPINMLVRERVRTRGKWKPWQIIVLILGSPLWVALLIVFLALLLVVYVVLWAMVLCVYAIELAFAASAVVCIPVGIIQWALDDPMEQVRLLIGTGIFAAGFAIIWLFVCKWATIGATRLSRAIARGVKRLFIGKEKKA